MSSSQESNTIQVYFKIPYTEITTLVVIKNSLTIREFLEYVNIEVRNNLNINDYYDIEVVEAGKPCDELALHIEPSDEETLLQRYGNINTLVAFYARPVNVITGVFIRTDNYSD